MSRDRTRTRNRSVDTAIEDDERRIDTESRERDTEERGLGSRVSGRARRLFSPRHFVAALLGALLGLFVASTFVPLPGSGFAGVFAVSFLFGLTLGEQRYAEMTLAGAIAAAAGTLLDFAVVAFLGGLGVSLAIVAGGLGGVVAAVGVYFGRDLRAGLTRDI